MAISAILVLLLGFIILSGIAVLMAAAAVMNHMHSA
jgi:hypothetical protein